MYIDKDSLIVDGVNLGTYITEVKYGYHKIWGDDTGRNLAFEMTGTLGGIFPKITVQFKKLTQEQLEIISPILDKATQSLTYHDPNKKKKITLSTYIGDWELVNRGIQQNKGFSCSFISRKKR